MKSGKYKRNEVIEPGSKDNDDDEMSQEFIIKRKVTDVNNVEKVVILFSNGTFKEYSKTE